MADVCFEPAVVIITLILIGRYLEARAKGRAAGTIAALIGLQPRTARLRRGSEITDVAIADLRIGDLVEIRPGERVPADGTVTEGTSWIDAAMISGEPIPVEAAPGAALVGGTVNQTGALTLRVTAVGAASVLSQIIRMVEDAQGFKLPIQALVDQVTLWRDTSRHSAAVKHLAPLRIGELQRKITGLEDMAATLQTQADSCSGDARPDCPILADLAKGERLSRPSLRTPLR